VDPPRELDAGVGPIERGEMVAMVGGGTAWFGGIRKYRSSSTPPWRMRCRRRWRRDGGDT
jgi:hypothetical protein